MAIPVVFYLLIALFSSGSDAAGVPNIVGKLDAALFNMPMISGIKWQFRLGDFIMLIGLVTLSIEIVKSTSTKSTAIANHATSIGIMVLSLILFLAVGNFSTSVFFFITMMCVLDVLAGVMVSIVAARRDFGVGDGFVG
jgi:CHASE2 domain-containing sensor protein